MNFMQCEKSARKNVDCIAQDGMKTLDYSGQQMEKFLTKKLLWIKRDVDKKSEAKNR